MDKKRVRGIVALFLVLSIGNFLRMDGHEDVHAVLFLTILCIGIFAGILISDLAHVFRTRKDDKNKMI